MSGKIRPIKTCDRERILEMMKIFYASEAVSTNGSLRLYKKCGYDALPYMEMKKNAGRG